MKQLFVIEDTLENKISYYHIAAFLVMLFFERTYTEIILISFILHVLIHSTRQKWRAVFNRQTLWVSSVFFISVIGLLYSSDKEEGLNDVQKQMAILLFPVFLTASGLDWKKYKMNLLLLFSLACTLVILYLYANAIHIILYNHLPLSFLFAQAFINHNFSSPIEMHATYLAMFSLLSAATFFYVFLRESRIIWRIVYLLCVLILVAGLLQLASRAVLISAIIIAPCFPFFLLKGTKRLTLIAAIAAACIVAALLITNISSFKMRYVAQFKDDLIQESINNEILEPRITRWHYIIPLIGKSPVIGYGSGSEQRLLDDLYFKNKLYSSYLHGLNAHNQYFSMLLKTGLWGLLIFLCTLFTGLATAFRNRDVLFCSFIIIICTVSVSENLLDVNKGIFFYAFFFPFFMLSGKPFDMLSRLR